MEIQFQMSKKISLAFLNKNIFCIHKRLLMPTKVATSPGVPQDSLLSGKISERLLSLDFMRGFIMVLLALESTGLYEHLFEATKGNALNNFFLQFFHHPWNGLRFWDLIQPGFMFMAGVSMAYSLNKQWARGVSWGQSFRKILKRCFLLFFWGVLDYAVRKNGLSFELWDVLTQLSFTTLVAFLIFRWNTTAQIVVCVGLLLLTEVLYRLQTCRGLINHLRTSTILAIILTVS